MYIAPFPESRWRNDIHDVTRKDNAYEPMKIHCATHTVSCFFKTRDSSLLQSRILFKKQSESSFFNVSFEPAIHRKNGFGRTIPIYRCNPSQRQSDPSKPRLFAQTKEVFIIFCWKATISGAALLPGFIDCFFRFPLDHDGDLHFRFQPITNLCR